MSDLIFDDIINDLREKEDNTIAKAFTANIAQLLRHNGIIPVITKVESIADTSDKNDYIIRMNYGVGFYELDTSEHDAKVRHDAIDELVGRILSNCTLKSTGEIVLEIRMDIFTFIVNRLKGAE